VREKERNRGDGTSVKWRRVKEKSFYYFYT